MLSSPDRVPVIPVNCVGVTGAGLAKTWADRYPDLAQDYRDLCRVHMVRPGQPRLIFRGNGAAVLFPTKDHWRDASRLGWIDAGLAVLSGLAMLPGLVAHYAVPRLGCGLGGLEWPDVRAMMITHLERPDGCFYVYGRHP